jgi:hypothetical protein
MSPQSMGVALITGAFSATGTVFADRLGPTDQQLLIHQATKCWLKARLAMFRLDYLSCFLTILATVLVGRKSWPGLLISIVNSLIVCLIGFRTSQFGFIPANLICICVYAFSIRSWIKKTNTHRIAEPVIRVIQGNTEPTECVARRQQPAQQFAAYNGVFYARCSSTSSFIHFR